jgi:hypothetical protein
MAISRNELIDFAEQHAGSECSEVMMRSSISRAYYAAFHALLPLVELLPPSSKCRGLDVTHVEVTERISEWKVGGVCPQLNDFRDVKGRALRAMETARAKRVIADYRLGHDVNGQECAAQLVRVRQVVRAADTLLGVVNGKSLESAG